MSQSSLPNQIPPPNAPFLQKGADGQDVVEWNWYLFLYNLTQQVLSQSTGVPASEVDQLDMVDLDAATTDIPQAYVEIYNVQNLLPDETIQNLQDLANAILLATDSLLQDPPSPAGPVEPITSPTSPYSYTAPHDGTFVISGPPTVTCNIIRYGVTVPTGMTDGTIPMRKNDQVSITWSGGTAPTMNFLPDK